MSTEYTFVLELPGKQPERITVQTRYFVIGRAQGDLLIDDASCSTRHVEIELDGNTVLVRDLGSSNGTILNGERVGRGIWAPGGHLTLGNARLTLLEVVGDGEPVRTQQFGAFSPMKTAPLEAKARQKVPVASQEETRGKTKESIPAALAKDQQVVPAGLPKRRSLLRFSALTTFVALFGVASALYYRKYQDEAASTPDETMQVRESSVNFVWSNGKEGAEAKGGTSPMRIRVSPNTSGKVSVGVQEEVAGGSGDQWRSAVWMATVNAARLNHEPLTKREFTAYVGGRVDGPSAGMLTAVAILAAMNGAELRSDTTITATINPDGSSGPVGGILLKMQAAKQSGLVRFGIPVGMEEESSGNGENKLNLLEEGRKLGLEVVQVADLHQAYTFVTNAKIERHPPILEEHLRLADHELALESRIQVWREYVQDSVSELREFAKKERFPRTFVDPTLSQLEAAIQKALKFERGGHLPAALDGYAEAVAAERITRKLMTTLGLLSKRKFKEINALRAEPPDLTSDLPALTALIDSTASTSRRAQLSAAFSLSRYVDAWAALEVARQLRKPPAKELAKCLSSYCQISDNLMREIMGQVIAPSLFEEIAHVYLELARGVRNLEPHDTQGAPLTKQELESVVTTYAAASSAVIKYLDTLVAERASREKGLSYQAMQELLAQNEPQYLLAVRASALASQGKLEDGTDLAPLTRLGAAGASYVRGALLINKWYALDAFVGEEGKLSVSNEPALQHQLALAERNAREEAGRAMVAVGFVPAGAKFAYQVASAKKSGAIEDQIAALASYWESSFWSEVASYRAE